MKKFVTILVVLAFAGAAHAVFSDDFDSNTSGNNYVWTQGDPVAGNNGWVALYDEETFSMDSAYISAAGAGIGTTKGAKGLAGYSQSQAGHPWYYGQGAARDITGDTDGNSVTVSLLINMSGTPAAGGLEEGEVRFYVGQAAGTTSASPPFPERHLFRITPTGNFSSIGTNWNDGAGWIFTSFDAGVAGVPDWTTWGWMKIIIEVDKSANYAHGFIQDVVDATGAPIGTPYDLGQFPGGNPGVATPFALEAAAFWIWDADGADWDTTVDNFQSGTVEQPELPGDADADNDVDGVDFGLWQAGYPMASGATLADGDFDGDGDVDGVDFGLWQAAYPTNVGGAGTLPEPATLAVLALGAIGFLARRR